MNANTSIAAVIAILSARKPTICGVTIPPNAAIARNNDIPVVEPLIILPTLDTVVGYIPAKKKPSPAIATVITARLWVAVSNIKNTVVATQYPDISLFLSTFDDILAVRSLPSITR